MGKTIAEKIFSRCANKDMRAGDEGIFWPDRIFAYDFPGFIEVFYKQCQDLGVYKVKHPEKTVFSIDHFVPAGNSSIVQYHKATYDMAKQFGYKVIDGKGIGFQNLCEMGYAKPGELSVHFDGHVSLLGACGCIAYTIDYSIIEALATQSFGDVIPQTVRINVVGTLQKGVAARDVFNYMLRDLGPSGALNCVVEFGGDGLINLNMDDRFTIANLIMFVGGLSAVFEQDENTLNFFKKHNVDYGTTIKSDCDAHFCKEYTLDLSKVTPLLVAPPTPCGVVDIKDYLGMTVNVGMVSSCACGRLTDFRQMAEILDGKHVASGFRLYGVPASTSIQAELAASGIMEKLIKAGVMMQYPSCDFCNGQLGVPLDGEIALSTATLNVPGRMGNKNADIYHASPYTFAATALTGKLSDPRELL